MSNLRTGWRWLFLLAALEAGAAFFMLARLPRGAAGYSAARLLLLAIIGLCAILSAVLSWRPLRALDRLVRPAGIIAFAVLAFISATSLFLLRYLDPEALAPIYDRLGIVIWYALVVGVQTAVFLLFARFGPHSEASSHLKSVMRPMVIAFGALLLVALLIATTRLGLTPDSAYWGEPGVPILGWQFALALIAGLAVLLVGLRVRNASRLDLWLAGALWLVAVVMWLSVPLSVMRNSFYAPMSPPSLQAFPNSDAGYYDSMAQSLLIGYPYQGEIPTRPLYITLLAGIHLLVGERYDLIVVAQTLILGIIPVLAYLLGSQLHSRAAGAMIALMAIFRELTSLWVSSQTRVSNTKTLLVDLPTLLLILAACLFVIRWLRHKDLRSAGLAGGVFGLLLLLRTQAAVIAPFVMILALLCYGTKSRRWMAPVAYFMGACFATVAPWLVHNLIVSGHLSFDAPFQYNIIASQYQYSGNLDIGDVDLQGRSLPELMLIFALRDPKFVLGFISTHFLATQIGGLLALPLAEPFNGLRASINLYWLRWNGSVGAFNAIIMILYLALIAVGLGATWRRLRWAGISPMFFSLGYSLANGLARFSGWRYDLPADWISYFYVGIGVAEIFGTFALLFGAESRRIFTAVEPFRESAGTRARPVLPVVGFVLLGSLPWLAQGVAGPRYAQQSPAGLVSALSSAAPVRELGIGTDQIQAFVSSPRATLLVGRVLYPRFFTRDDGLPSTHPWPAYAPRDFPRLGFILLNEIRHDVILPARQPPDTVQHAADAIVLGCQGPDYVEARLILLPATGSAIAGAPLNTPCP